MILGIVYLLGAVYLFLKIRQLLGMDNSTLWQRVTKWWK